MKLCYFNDWRLGVVKGDAVVDVTDVVKHIPHIDTRDLIIGLIANWDSYKDKVDKAANETTGMPLKNVRLRPPVPKPGNIVCMAVNYMEDGTLKEKPQINAFHKAASAVIGDGDTMVLPDVPASIFEGASRACPSPAQARPRPRRCWPARQAAPWCRRRRSPQRPPCGRH